jgi:hypothetical protein
MLSVAAPVHKEQALILLKEAHELVLIFQKITISLKIDN